VLNKFGSSGHGEAQVQYLDGDFRVISPGPYVRCAVDRCADTARRTEILERRSAGGLRYPQRRAATAFSKGAEELILRATRWLLPLLHDHRYFFSRVRNSRS